MLALPTRSFEFFVCGRFFFSKNLLAFELSALPRSTRPRPHSVRDRRRASLAPQEVFGGCCCCCCCRRRCDCDAPTTLQTSPPLTPKPRPSPMTRACPLPGPRPLPPRRAARNPWSPTPRRQEHAPVTSVIGVAQTPLTERAPQDRVPPPWNESGRHPRLAPAPLSQERSAPPSLSSLTPGTVDGAPTPCWNGTRSP
jgi:hypothetical protein